MGLVRTLKEMARHVLYAAGSRRRLAHLAPTGRQDRFAAIYSSKVWTAGDAQVPLSGQGSSLQATERLREELPRLVEKLGVKTLVDVGCGDFTWMREIELPCDYIGTDIVPEVIDRNRELFSGPRKSFLLGDAVEGDLPAADLMLCREMLFHLSFDDAFAVLQNMLAAGPRHILLTSDRGTAVNANIESGDYRLLNLERRPFKLPAPRAEIDDSAVLPGRFIGLWDVADLRPILDGAPQRN